MRTIILKEHWIGIMMMKEINHTNHPIFYQGQTNLSIGNVMFVVIKAILQRLLLAMQEQSFHVRNVQLKVEQINVTEKNQ